MAFRRNEELGEYGEVLDPEENSWGYGYATPEPSSYSPYNYSVAGGVPTQRTGGSATSPHQTSWWAAPSTVANRFSTPERSRPSGGSLGSQPFFIPSSTGRTTTQRNIPPENVPIPQIGKLPEFKMPEWDENRISELTQQESAPDIRRLRQQVREVQGKYYDNPNVKRMTLRDAMAGYGMGLEDVMAGARRRAQSEYAAEYGPQATKAQAEYQAELSKVMATYQAAWQDYQNKIAKQTVTTMG